MNFEQMICEARKAYKSEDYYDALNLYSELFDALPEELNDKEDELMAECVLMIACCMVYGLEVKDKESLIDIRETHLKYVEMAAEYSESLEDLKSRMEMIIDRLNCQYYETSKLFIEKVNDIKEFDKYVDFRGVIFDWHINIYAIAKEKAGDFESDEPLKLEGFLGEKEDALVSNILFDKAQSVHEQYLALSDDFPYFFQTVALRAVNLYGLALKLIIFSNSNASESDKLVRKKAKASLYCNMLNSMIVSNGKTWSLWCGVESRQNLYNDLMELVDEIKKTDPSYELPVSVSAEGKPQQQKSGGCYVATCVYGSYDCPQVWTLRRYRDDTLGSTWYGRLFIRTYYAISPTLVKWFGKTNWFKKLWKGKLDRMVAKLQNNGVEDTPYEDKEW